MTFEQKFIINNCSQNFLHATLQYYYLSTIKEISLVLGILTKTHKTTFTQAQYPIVFVKPFWNYLEAYP